MTHIRSTPHTLVAGGSGFIGSHICRRLLDEGHAVTVVDNLLSGRLTNIENLLTNPHFSFLHADISTHQEIGGQYEFILNLACPASPVDYMKYPLQTLDVGSRGTRRLLEMADDSGARFLMASTSEIYGDPLIHPQKETYWGNVNPIGPRSVYDESKRFSEALVSAYHRERGVETRIVRIFNTYGPGMRLDDGRVLPTFMRQAIKNEPISVFGDGSQTRSFCYVEDLVEGVLRLLRSEVTTPVNIGNPEEVTIAAFAEEIVELTDSESSISYHPLPKDDPKVRKPDISKARELLDWEPRIDRQEGLRRCLGYFRDEVWVERTGFFEMVDSEVATATTDGEQLRPDKRREDHPALVRPRHTRGTTGSKQPASK